MVTTEQMKEKKERPVGKFLSTEERLVPLESKGKLHPMSCSPVFVNKVLFEQATSVHLYLLYGCFQVTTAELHSCDRNHVTPKATWTVKKSFATLQQNSLRHPWVKV